MSDSSPRRLVVELPLPPAELSPNPKRAVNWRRKSIAVRNYRSECGVCAVAAFRGRYAAPDHSPQTPETVWPFEPPHRVRLSVAFYTARRRGVPDGRYRPQDPDNALSACKAAIDSLRDARIIAGDTANHLEIGGVVIHSRAKEHQGRAALVLTIEEVTGDA